MANHSIEEKLEDALVAVITAEAGVDLSSVTINSAFDTSEDLALPLISVAVEKAEVAEPDVETMTGNYICTVRVSLWTDLHASTRAQHATLAAAVRDVLFASNMIALLNAAGVADFTAIQASVRSFERTIDQNARRTDSIMEVYCFPS